MCFLIVTKNGEVSKISRGEFSLRGMDGKITAEDYFLPLVAEGLGWVGAEESYHLAGQDVKGREGLGLPPYLLPRWTHHFLGRPGKDGGGGKIWGFSSVERQGTSPRKVRTEKHSTISVVSSTTYLSNLWTFGGATVGPPGGRHNSEIQE